MLTVTLYTRANSKECEEVKALLSQVQNEFPHRLVEIDVNSAPDMWKEYKEAVPVIEAGPYKARAPITLQNLKMTLGAARDRQATLEKVDPDGYKKRIQRGSTVSGGDKISNWLSKHYLALLNFLILIYVGLPMLAPMLMKAGLPLPAKVIYTVYSPLCHQLGFRSFFLFGEQPFYPRADANVAGYQTFAQATHLGESGVYQDVLAAREYVGDETVGYKMALCERDIAIYSALFLFGLLYAATGRRLPKIHWAIWLLIGIAPIGLDGFSQLLSQINLPALSNIFSYRESTPFLRVLTGGLFGFMTAWFGFPYIEESMQETREVLAKKQAVIDSVNRKP